MREIFNRESWPVKSGEWRLVTLASLFSFGSVALAIFFRTWSDTIFLSHFSVDQVPIFYIWSAFAFAPVTMGYTWLSRRLPPVKLNTFTLLLFSALSSLCAQLPTEKTHIFIILLCMSLVSPLVSAICWSVVLERLDSLQSKRLIPLIGSAATVGAIVAGGVAAETIEIGGLAGLITLISLTLIGLALLPSTLLTRFNSRRRSEDSVAQREDNIAQREDSVAQREDSVAQRENNIAQREDKSNEPQGRGTLSNLTPILSSPLLTITVIATLMMATTTNLVDYLFKAEVQRAIPVSEIGPFLARFHAVTNLLIFLLQLFILGRITDRLGLKWAYSLYPSTLIMVGTFCLFPIGWMGLILLRGADTLMKFTVYSNTENIVLTPVPYLMRTQVKVLLKGAIYPLGGLIAGVLIWSLTSICGEDSGLKIRSILIITLILSLLWMRFTQRAHIYYIEQLSENLSLERDLHSSAEVDDTLLSALSVELIRGDINAANFIERCNEALKLPVDTLTSRWKRDPKTRADLIEWLENICRARGAKSVSAILESQSPLES